MNIPTYTPVPSAPVAPGGTPFTYNFYPSTQASNFGYQDREQLIQAPSHDSQNNNEHQNFSPSSQLHPASSHSSSSSPSTASSTTTTADKNSEPEYEYYYEYYDEDDDVVNDKQQQSPNIIPPYGFGHQRRPLPRRSFAHPPPQKLDRRIAGIRRNDAIFRQDNGGGGIASLAGYAATAMRVISLVSSIMNGDSDSGQAALELIGQVVMPALSGAFSGGGGGPAKPAVSSDPDRIDTAVSESDEELDEAMGTLMALGGKYLREMAIWAYEMATQQPTDRIGVAAAAEDEEEVEVVTVVETASKPKPPKKKKKKVVTRKKKDPKWSVLKKLKPEELESLGLKAVDAGAKPVKLQQAFASAQINGDWSHLEKEIVAALGENSLPVDNDPANWIETVTYIEVDDDDADVVSAGSSTSTITVTRPASSTSTSSGSTSPLNVLGSVVSGGAELIGNLIGGGGPGAGGVDKIGVAADTSSTSSVSTSEAPTGLAYYAAVAQNYAQRINKVIEGPDPTLPITDPMDASLVTRFIKEFELQQEALAFQYGVNQVIATVNTYIGDDATSASSSGSNTQHRPTSSSSSTSTSTSSTSDTGGVLGLITGIPQAIGGMAVSALKFVSPGGATRAQEKIDGGEGGETFSEVSYLNPLNTVAVGALGTAAIGSVLWLSYVQSVENRRRQDTGSYDYYPSDNHVDYDQFYYEDEDAAASAPQYRYKRNADDKENSGIWTDDQERDPAEEGVREEEDIIEQISRSDLETNNVVDSPADDDDYQDVDGQRRGETQAVATMGILGMAALGIAGWSFVESNKFRITYKRRKKRSQGMLRLFKALAECDQICPYDKTTKSPKWKKKSDQICLKMRKKCLQERLGKE